MKVMFDTNVFSNLSNGKIDPAKIPSNWKPIATHIQWDEIQATKDVGRREEIAAVYYHHLTERVPTSSAVWDASKWDQAQWPSPESKYQAIYQRLEENKRHRNNAKDALIADTCLQNSFILVTNDGNLSDVAREFGIEVTDLQTA